MSGTEITANNERFCTALGEHRMDTLLELYDHEVVLLIPGAPPIRGHSGVRAYYDGVFAAGVQGAEMRTLQLEELGGAIVEIGEYTMDVAPTDAPAVRDTGKYFVIHRRQDSGAWAMWLDMFHSDGPAT